MKPIDRFTALVSFFELESPTPHRDGLPIARIGDVGLGGGDEGHDVGLTLALRVAGGHTCTSPPSLTSMVVTILAFRCDAILVEIFGSQS